METLQNDIKIINRYEESYIPPVLTVRQFSKKYPAFPEGGIRHLIFNEETNGFKEAFLRVGKKRLINESVFFQMPCQFYLAACRFSLPPRWSGDQNYSSRHAP